MPRLNAVELMKGVELRRSKKASRVSLRLDVKQECVILTVPAKASKSRALEFARDNSEWIEKKLASIPPVLPLPDGDCEKTLRRRARMVITELAHEKADRIGKKIKGIAIRDTKTRWGSCSAQGRLNFSWRLLLAPPFVLDYVVAHEVAHLKIMNHSKKFWDLCASLHDGNIKTSRQWLKDNGEKLLRYK